MLTSLANHMLVTHVVAHCVHACCGVNRVDARRRRRSKCSLTDDGSTDRGAEAYSQLPAYAHVALPRVLESWCVWLVHAACRAVQCCVACRSVVVSCVEAWHSAEQCGVLRCGEARRDVAWRGVAWRAAAHTCMHVQMPSRKLLDAKFQGPVSVVNSFSEIQNGLVLCAQFFRTKMTPTSSRL